jgi:hypothetical protein
LCVPGHFQERDWSTAEQIEVGAAEHLLCQPDSSATGQPERDRNQHPEQ